MKKTIIAIVIIAVVAFGGYFLLGGSTQPPTAQPSASEPATPEQPATSQAPVVKENSVTYMGSGFSPSTLKVKKGETVTFKNQSSRAMWTSSSMHPSHRDYPTTGGCLGSTFDACKGIQPNENWSFKFDIVGTWKYHNHVNPSDTGTIVVE